MTFPRIQSRIPVIFAAAVSIGVLAQAASPAHAASPAWNPSVTEKLVKLPQEYLKKSLDRDFRRSPLADAIRNTEEEIALKLQTLGDLRAAAEQSDGELNTELRHQLLAEKQQYLKLMRQRQGLKRKHLNKRRRVYQRILRKVLRKKQNETPEQQVELVQQQQAAQARFQRTVEAVDMKVFATTVAPQSKYATEYAKNLSAANALLKAISSHPANVERKDISPADKADYLRRLVADTDSELALVQQEQEIVGYMAKLVSLNAVALSEEIAEDEEEAIAEGEEEKSPITSALNHFID